jgi:hypothetical protein
VWTFPLGDQLGAYTFVAEALLAAEDKDRVAIYALAQRTLEVIGHVILHRRARDRAHRLIESLTA